ncbi:MAG: PQQ-dependent sugar dehydrogenase [Sporosarcina sp.]
MKRLLLLLFLIMPAGCNQEASLASNHDRVEKVVTHLISPWSIDYDGESFFISEKAGTIVKVRQGGKLIREDVHLSAPLSNVAESGLLGFVLDKDFRESHKAYAYYTYDLGGAPINRIVTLQYDGGSWYENEILLDGIESGPVHHGGRLAFSPDNILYATIGDGANPDSAQNLNSFNGKILRLNKENTFEIVSSGHRNPQGLAWDKDGKLFASEHGQSANDEVNIIVRGKNYGWPVIEGTETRDGLETPFLTSGSRKTWAPSGMVFHKGLLYVAALRGEAILVVDTKSGEVVDRIEGFGRIRDVFSDGKSLYFITNNTDGRGKPTDEDDVLYRLRRN